MITASLGAAVSDAAGGRSGGARGVVEAGRSGGVLLPLPQSCDEAVLEARRGRRQDQVRRVRDQRRGVGRRGRRRHHPHPAALDHRVDHAGRLRQTLLQPPPPEPGGRQRSCVPSSRR